MQWEPEPPLPLGTAVGTLLDSVTATLLADWRAEAGETLDQLLRQRPAGLPPALTLAQLLEGESAVHTRPWRSPWLHGCIACMLFVAEAVAGAPADCATAGRVAYGESIGLQLHPKCDSAAELLPGCTTSPGRHGEFVCCLLAAQACRTCQWFVESYVSCLVDLARQVCLNFCAFACRALADMAGSDS